MSSSTASVIIQKGFAVYIDIWAKCYAGDLKLETGVSLIFDSVEYQGSSLTVYGIKLRAGYSQVDEFSLTKGL